MYIVSSIPVAGFVPDASKTESTCHIFQVRLAWWISLLVTICTRILDQYSLFVQCVHTYFVPALLIIYIRLNGPRAMTLRFMHRKVVLEKLISFGFLSQNIDRK